MELAKLEQLQETLPGRCIVSVSYGDERGVGHQTLIVKTRGKTITQSEFDLAIIQQIVIIGAKNIENFKLIKDNKHWEFILKKQ